MIVMKFGGSSLANAERLRNMASIVKAQLSRRPVLVLSAMGDTTDYLLEAGQAALTKRELSIDKIKKTHLEAISALALPCQAQESINALFYELESLVKGIALIQELTAKTLDYLVSFGERLSVRIAAAYLASLGIHARHFDAWEAGFISDSNYGSAELLDTSGDLIAQKINAFLKEGILPVITGFIAKDANGAVTTLGRGGSDLSATVIASASGAEEAQVWKDVDGILSADPNIVKEARPVEEVSYEEAAELAYFGAQVLHPRAMQPCVKSGTPVLVKNSFNVEAAGTRIVGSIKKNKTLVRAISSRRDVTLVDIVSTRMLGQHGFLAGVFKEFERQKISVDMVATSEVSISLTLDASYNLLELKNELSKIAAVEIKTRKAIITIIGDVRRSSEILARAFGKCASLGLAVEMVSQGASKVNISFIVNDDKAVETVRALHLEFFGAPL